jgi:hypothetical protein
MRRILPMIPLSALVLALLMTVIAPAMAEDQTRDPAAPQPPGASPPQPQSTDPNWPAGLREWDSSERNPKGGNPDEAEKRGLTSPEVQKSQMPQPTAQGTRPPETPTIEEEHSGLYAALSAVRRAPTLLDGTTMPRPNKYASEPETEMTPDPAGNPERLFPEDYVE